MGRLDMMVDESVKLLYLGLSPVEKTTTLSPLLPSATELHSQLKRMGMCHGAYGKPNTSSRSPRNSQHNQRTE